MKINVLHSDKIEQSTFSFLFPLLRLKHQLLESGYKIEFFQNLLKKKIFECDILFIESKYLKNLSSKCNSISLERFFLKLRKKINKIFFFDNSDSSSLLNYDVIDHVDLYFKSQILKNSEDYKKKIYGCRLYCEYYKKKYNVRDEENSYSSPLKSDQVKKLRLSWNSGFSDYSFYGPITKKLYSIFPLDFFLSGPIIKKKDTKTLDINLRMNLKYSRNTISFHRNKMIELFDKPTHKVNRLKYFKELHNSRIVLSPFGWGEINYRDFETFLYGALLVKPNMDHMTTWPDYYKKNKTYISVDWSFRSLKKEIEYILDNYTIFNEISIAGHENYLKWKNKEFLKHEFLKRFKNFFS